MKYSLPRFLVRLTHAAAPLLFLAASAPAWSQTADCLAEATPVQSIDMRVLVVTADGGEVVLPAITSTLDHLGIPFDTFVARDRMLTRDVLCSAEDGFGHARYQAVLLTTGNLSFLADPATGTYESALSFEEWARLWQFEAKYRIRQATFYTFPGGWPDTYGLSWPTAVDTTGTPLTTQLTASAPTGSTDPSGRQVFPYLRPGNPVTITNAYTYLSTPVAGEAVTPLLVDAAGHALASIRTYTDGRKNLALTADGNQYLVHTQSLAYGIVNWATKGLYIGLRRVYLSPQPDDVLIADDIWDPATGSDQSGATYRITGTDYLRFVAWQAARNNNLNGGQLRVEMPFNGIGAVLGYSPLSPAIIDSLTPAIVATNDPFDWLSHTYSHRNLDSPTTYAQTLRELRDNDTIAKRSLLLRKYWRDALITPDVSGLNNPEALRAMSDFGIRYVVSDTSKFCGNRDGTPRPCPKPNTGVYNDLQPNILMVPRYPANLFYNVCTPAQWVSEYNFLYRSYWGRDLSYAEILEKESDTWLRYLMTYDVRPVMFHQSNMCAYDGTRSLLGDLIDTTFAKYNRIYNLPVNSRQLRQIGALMDERMRLASALGAPAGTRLDARLLPGTGSSSIVLSNPTAGAVTVPLTGVNWSVAASRETYGGQTTSRVVVGAQGGQVTVTGVPAW